MNKPEVLSSNQVTSKVTRIPKSALLAGAALGLPLAAHADIKFVNLQQTVSSDSNPTFNLDMDGDGTTDFTFSAGLISDTVTPGTGNGYVGTDTNNPTPLAAGASIGSTNTFETGTGVLQNTKQKKFPLDKQKGPWDTSGGFQYLGVEFYIGAVNPADLHYGWINLSACTPDKNTGCSPTIDPGVIQINGYAYNTAAGQPINAGEVPEPSMLPLLALGAAGLAALRSRRTKAA
jgi:hypothetical protein